MRLLRAASRLRSWVAMAASYALALQIVLGGVLIGQLSAASLGFSDLSAICAGHNGPDDDAGSSKKPAHEPPCVFCTLAKNGSGTLPGAIAPASVDYSARLVPQPRGDEVVVAFASPTGHYQRGPPVSAAFAG
jgi:hypothetical protein